MEGLKNYGRYFDLEFDDIFKVKIDLNKAIKYTVGRTEIYA